MLILHMSSDDTVRPPTRAASLGNIKFFLLGLSVVPALVCGLFLLSILALLLLGCPACDSTDFYGHVEYGFRFTSTMTLGLLLYFWYILIPLSALPPVIGLILDYRRAEQYFRSPELPPE
jgi:hypothetical protein